MPGILSHFHMLLIPGRICMGVAPCKYYSELFAKFILLTWIRTNGTLTIRDLQQVQLT